MYVMINQCPGSEIKTKKEKLVLKLQLQRLQHHTVFPISTYKYFFMKATEIANHTSGTERKYSFLTTAMLSTT